MRSLVCSLFALCALAAPAFAQKAADVVAVNDNRPGLPHVLMIMGQGPPGESSRSRRWNRDTAHGTLGLVRALDPMLVGRPHVDLGRVASALCPAC